MPTRYKRLLVLVGGLLLVLIGFMVYRSMQFHVTGTSPNHNKYPASLSSLEIRFNRDLDTEQLEQRITKNMDQVVQASFTGKIRATVDTNKLTLRFQKTPNVGNYHIKLVDIPATDGSVLTTTVSLKVRDIPFDQLTNEEKKQYTALATTFDDIDYTKYPLLAKLPYETDKYKVSFRYGDNDPAPIVIITMKFFPPGNNAQPATPAQQQEYINNIRTYRAAALDWAKSQGLDYGIYTMEYTELELRTEFPAGKARTFFEKDPEAE